MPRPAVSQFLGAVVAILVMIAAALGVGRLLERRRDGNVDRDIAFAGPGACRLDVYHPESFEADDPIIVFLYGGAWRAGGKDHYAFVGRAFAAAGFTTVVPDYRRYPRGRFPDFVEDIAAAVAWTHRTLSGDGARRIVLVGHSAGAHIAALVALDPRYLGAEGLSSDVLKGWVGLAGPYALDPLSLVFTKKVFAAAGDDVSCAMPVALASKDAPPALLIHGTGDAIVYSWNSEALAEAIRSVGGTATCRLLEKLGHIGIALSFRFPKLDGGEMMRAIAGFARAS